MESKSKMIGLHIKRCHFWKCHIWNGEQQLKRVSVQLTHREMKAEEAKAAKLDLEISSAIKNLVEKID